MAYGKTFNLSECGVNVLTGEACAFAMRLLCDLNQTGVDLVRGYFGLPVDCPLARNWNSTVAGEPAIASIMLHRDVFAGLVVFAARRAGFEYIVHQKGAWTCYAFNSDDIKTNPGLQLYVDGTAHMLECGEAIVYRNPKACGPNVDGRNVHQFTGRLV